jgi:hypothetical protein
VLLQKQPRDETDRTRADDEHLRIGMTEHRVASSRVLRPGDARATFAPEVGKWHRQAQRTEFWAHCDIRYKHHSRRTRGNRRTSAGNFGKGADFFRAATVISRWSGR